MQYVAEKDEDEQKTSKTKSGKLALTERLNEGDKEGRRKTDERRTGKIRGRQTERGREKDRGRKMFRAREEQNEGNMAAEVKKYGKRERVS